MSRNDTNCEHRLCRTSNYIIRTIVYFWNRHMPNVVAALFLTASLCLNAIMLSLSHERVPMQGKVLPDVLFDLGPYSERCFIISQVYIGVQNICFLLLLIFHPEREIILRRFMFIIGIVYALRTITFSGTQFPQPSKTANCFPKLNDNLTTIEFVSEIFKRALKHSISVGFIRHQRYKLCGDNIYSGHTVIIVTVYLFINTYFFASKHQNRILFIILENVHFALATIAVLCVFLSRQNYTVDVILSYYVVTQLFWTYHSLCLERCMFQELRYRYEHFKRGSNNGSSRKSVVSFKNQKSISLRMIPREDSNMLSLVWWWPMFVYLEIIKAQPDTLNWRSGQTDRETTIHHCFLSFYS